MYFIEIVGIDGNKRAINVNKIEIIEDKSVTVNGKKIPCVETYQELCNLIKKLDRLKNEIYMR